MSIPLFYVQGVATVTGIPSSTVRPVVKDLVDVAVRGLPQVGGCTAAKCYERLDHPIWELLVDLLAAVQPAAARSSL